MIDPPYVETHLPFHERSPLSTSPALSEECPSRASLCEETFLFFPPGAGGEDSLISALVEDLLRSSFTSFFWRLRSSSANRWGYISFARLKNSTASSASEAFSVTALLKRERFFGGATGSAAQLSSRISAMVVCETACHKRREEVWWDDAT
jgi:hypothetical protein